MNEDVKAREAQESAGGQPLDRLTKEVRGLVEALGARAVGSLAGRVDTLTGRLSKYAEGGGAPVAGGGEASGGPSAAVGGIKRVGQVVKGAAQVAKGAGTVAKAVSGGKSGGGRAEGSKIKVTNVVETIDIGAPVEVVYNQWTRFEDFPSFMKKVEHVKQDSDEQLTWKAQIFWSHRSWKSEIVEQVPDERIIWRSEGDKGYVDGAVTFHDLAPGLTRVALVLEYHPKGFFEHVGNLWRAQGRRARLELKHFRRHVMTQTLLHPDEVEGWRGEIREGRVVEERPEEEGAEEESAEEGERGEAEEGAEEGERGEAEEGAEEGERDETEEHEEAEERQPANP